MPASWPLLSDLTAYLGALTSFTVPGSIPTQSRVDAAIAEWEGLTGWKPFLGATQTRKFDPPATGTVLRLDAGLVAVTTLSIAGTAQTADTDYWLIGNTAPYQGIKFARTVYGLPKTISIAGTWGYGSSVPDDAWQSVLYLAAEQCAIALREEAGSVPIDWKEDDVSEKPVKDLLEAMGKGWREYAERSAKRYRRVAVGF